MNKAATTSTAAPVKKRLSLVASLFLIGMTVPGGAHADQCTDFSARVAGKLLDVTPSSSLRHILNKAVVDKFENGLIAPSLRPSLILTALATEPATVFDLTEVGRIITDYSFDRLDQVPAEVSNLKAIMDQGGSGEVLRQALLSAFEVLKDDPTRGGTLSDVHPIAFKVEPDLEALIALSKLDTTDGIIAKGVLRFLIARETEDGFTPSLEPAALVAVHRNRVMQDLLYLGYPCQQALQRAEGVPAQILQTPQIAARYSNRSVTYGEGRAAVEIPYPNGYRFTPRLSFRSPRPLRGTSVSDFRTQYQGEYQVTDFAYGEFNNYVVHVRGFYVATAIMNLIQSFPDKNVTLSYNPDFFKERGVEHFPHYFRRQLTINGVPSNRVRFEVNRGLETDLESIGYAWSRDGWLSARDTRSGQMVRLQQWAKQPEFTNTKISTDGGAHYPIGRYFFLNRSIWQQPGAGWNSNAELKETYRRLTGREPILIAEDHPDAFSPANHVDTYMIFLPQPNGKPAIGLVDYRAGAQMAATWSEAKHKEILRERFLLQRQALRLDRDERPIVTLHDWQNEAIGLPRYVREKGFMTDRALLTEERYPDIESTDLEAESLRKAGFRVFRFPALVDYGAANGLVELTRDGATFTTATFGIEEFDAALAQRIGAFGYSLRLIPALNGVSPGAGYHCLTNENRLLVNPLSSRAMRR